MGEAAALGVGDRTPCEGIRVPPQALIATRRAGSHETAGQRRADPIERVNGWRESGVTSLLTDCPSPSGGGSGWGCPGLPNPPVAATFAPQEFVVDQGAPQLAVVRPDPPQLSIDLLLGKALPEGKDPGHLGEYHPAARIAGRPAQDSAILPERPDLTGHLGGIQLHRTHL